jgi:hypothetical protein
LDVLKTTRRLIRARSSARVKATNGNVNGDDVSSGARASEAYSDATDVAGDENRAKVVEICLVD